MIRKGLSLPQVFPQPFHRWRPNGGKQIRKVSGGVDHVQSTRAVCTMHGYIPSAFCASDLLDEDVAGHGDDDDVAVRTESRTSTCQRCGVAPSAPELLRDTPGHGTRARHVKRTWPKPRCANNRRLKRGKIARIIICR
jgi:hypothetical protein